MDHRPLGHSSLDASRLGLGLMTMSGIYGKGDDQESVDTIRHAIERGVNFLDSSDMYGWGQNEELLGRALKGSGLRNRVLVTTKFGQVRAEGGRNLVNGRPEYVQQACDASLKRLGVDVIDLYSQHRVDPSVPIEDTVGAMAKLIQQGKVRAIGLSEAAPATIRKAHAVHPISTIQMEYSLLYRKEAEETLPLCRELGITYVAYSPLGRGFLTGNFKTLSDIPEGDRRRDHPRFQESNFPRNRELVREDRADRPGEGLHAGAARAGLAPGSGREHHPDPGDQAEGPGGREPRRPQGPARQAGRGSHLGGGAGRGGGRHALPRAPDEVRVPLGGIAMAISGKLLHVDLTTGQTRTEDVPETLMRRYLGGGALAAHILLRDMPPGVDPLGPDNVLAFVTSVLNGLSLSGTNRYTAAAKSPLTGGYGESEAGGWWGPELRAAGWDGVVIRGQAEHPVYLWIKDGQVELRDARPLLGQTLRARFRTGSSRSSGTSAFACCRPGSPASGACASPPS